MTGRKFGPDDVEPVSPLGDFTFDGLRKHKPVNAEIISAEEPQPLSLDVHEPRRFEFNAEGQLVVVGYSVSETMRLMLAYREHMEDLARRMTALQEATTHAMDAFRQAFPPEGEQP